jgi:DNA-binding response OmpR family regulator
MALANTADIIILDVMLPQTNGFALCRKIRDQGCSTPIIFLTAKGDIVDKGTGFDAGGDDYVVKPFLSEELFMRVSAVLRRSSTAQATDVNSVIPHGSLELGDLQIMYDQYLVEKNGVNVELTAKEFEIIRLLSSSVGSVFGKEQIYEYLWNEANPLSLDSITVLVRRIREKIEDDPSDPKHLLTVWRVGYRLV